jgi:hypothetical protein
LRLLGLLPAVLLLISTLLPASVLLRLLPSALLLGLVGLLVASSLGVAAALVAGVVRLAAEELHVVGEDFGHVFGVAVLVVVGAGADAALDEELRAFLDVLLCYLC